MTRDIQKIEYQSGVLRRGMKPSDLAMQKWQGEAIPSDLRQAVIEEGLLDLGGTYGDKTASKLLEYDQLKIVLADDIVEITVFNRRMLLSSNDAKFQRIHRALCKLNKAMMAVPDVFTAEERAGVDPRLITSSSS